MELCVQAVLRHKDANERVEALAAALAARSAEVAELRRDIAAADIRHKVLSPTASSGKHVSQHPEQRTGQHLL